MVAQAYAPLMRSLPMRSSALRVFDAVAAVAGAAGLGDGFENIQRNAIGAIADGVKGQLESGLVPFDGHGLQLFGVVGENSSAGGIIVVRFEKRDGARAQSYIGDG